MNREIAVIAEETIVAMRPQFELIAREGGNLVNWSTELGFAVEACINNPALQECTKESIQSAVVNVASVGLSLNPVHGHAFLVPQYNKQLKMKQAALRVAAKGIVALATMPGGPLRYCKAEVVYRNDDFSYRGPFEVPDHNCDPFSEDRGDPVGVYCVARTHAGDTLVETAPWSEVQKARAAAAQDYVWAQWEDEMAKKFIIKRASKQWPRMSQNDPVQRAVGALNDMEGSEELLDTRLNRVTDALLDALALGLEGDSVIYETLEELTEAELRALWVAQSKGGYLTIDQKKASQGGQDAPHQRDSEQDARRTERLVPERRRLPDPRMPRLYRSRDQPNRRRHRSAVSGLLPRL